MNAYWHNDPWQDPARVYRGVVRAPFQNSIEVARIDDDTGDTLTRTLDQRHDVFSHSDGFNWGYGGSGPRQSALAILCDAVGPHLAMRLYGTFVNAFVSQWPKDEPFEISLEEVIDWIEDAWSHGYSENGQNRSVWQDARAP